MTIMGTFVLAPPAAGALAVEPTRCEGCGLGYLVAGSIVAASHNFATCAAYKRGFEAGVASERAKVRP